MVRASEKITNCFPRMNFSSKIAFQFHVMISQKNCLHCKFCDKAKIKMYLLSKYYYLFAHSPHQIFKSYNHSESWTIPKNIVTFLLLLAIKVIFVSVKIINWKIFRKYPKLATLILWIDNLIGRQPTNIFYLDCLLKQHKLLPSAML